MFLGTHTPRLDDKSRLALPARFRPDLAGGLVLTKGENRCLYAFSLDEFERVSQLIRSAPAGTQRTGRDNARVFFASASLETPDGQGRVTIPAPLRSYAGLVKDCAVIGANTRVEIWDAGAWTRYLAATEPAFADAEAEVVPGLN